MDSMKDMIAGVRQHAAENYETGGWDYLIECYSDLEIAEAIENAGAQSIAEAVDVLGCDLAIRDDYRRDIEATAW